MFQKDLPDGEQGAVVAVSLAMTAFSLIATAGLLWFTWKRGADNHISVDIRGIYFVQIVCLLFNIVSLLWAKGGERYIGAAGILICSFGIVVIYVIDSNNLLVGYEVWIRRGMPSRWEK